MKMGNWEERLLGFTSVSNRIFGRVKERSSPRLFSGWLVMEKIIV